MFKINNSDAKILIVDDITENILLISSILELEEYKVSIAKNGIDAIKIARTQFPDLILLDIMMPEMDGYEVCTILKENPKTAGIPIIFLTAKLDQEDQVLGLQKGAIDYITKPYNTQILLQKVATQIQLKKSIDIIKSQRENLDIMNRTKDKFYSGIAEYLKIPLDLISDRSEKAMECNDLPDIKMMLSEIRKASSMSSKLLFSLIEWLRIQTGEISLQQEFISINTVIDKKISEVKRAAFSKNILLYKSSLPNLKVFADRSLLEKIFDYLLPNMVNLAEKGAEIMVSTREVAFRNPQKSTISGATKFLKVKISVLGKNSIKKIPTKAFSIKHLLQNIGNSNETDQQFGFILSKSYVEKNEGSIWFDADNEGEYNFHFTIPYANS